MTVKKWQQQLYCDNDFDRGYQLQMETTEMNLENIVNEPVSSMLTEQTMTAKEATEYLGYADTSSFREQRTKYNKKYPETPIQAIDNKGTHLVSDIQKLKEFVNLHTKRRKSKSIPNGGEQLNFNNEQSKLKEASTLVEATALTVDDEFKNLIPNPKEEERQQLEENILQDGIREPIVVWNINNELVIVDGHNRHSIATKHNLPIPIKEMTFDSRDDVRLWIVKNQLGRRNLDSDYQRGIIALKLKPIIAARAKQNMLATQNNNLAASSILTEQIDTREEIAKIAGLSTGSISKIEKISNEATDEIKQKVYDGTLSINKGYEATKALKDKQSEEQGRDSPKHQKSKTHTVKEYKMLIALIKKADSISEEIKNIIDKFENNSPVNGA